MHGVHADDRYSCVQPQPMRRIGGADEWAGGAVHVEPRERELVHADVQQRVHGVGHEDVLPWHSHRCCEVQGPVHGLRPPQRPDRHLLGKLGPPCDVHGLLQHRLLGCNRHCRPNFGPDSRPNASSYSGSDCIANTFTHTRPHSNTDDCNTDEDTDDCNTDDCDPHNLGQTPAQEFLGHTANRRGMQLRGLPSAANADARAAGAR
jgi:hypothetical protein